MPLPWHLLVIAYVLTIVSLGIRSQLTEDTRFGWGMFSYDLTYTIDYSWVDDDGSETPYMPGEELKGRARAKLMTGAHRTRYGLGALRSWVRGYVSYVAQHSPKQNASFRARLTYRKHDGPPLTELWTATP